MLKSVSPFFFSPTSLLYISRLVAYVHNLPWIFNQVKARKFCLFHCELHTLAAVPPSGSLFHPSLLHRNLSTTLLVKQSERQKLLLYFRLWHCYMSGHILVLPYFVLGSALSCWSQ